MTTWPTLLRRGILAVSLLIAGPATADVVHFSSAAPAEESGTPLWGHLEKPDGNGLFPALVLMHGCAGIHPTHQRWAALFNEMGYVTLILDSFGPRSEFNLCTKRFQAASPDVRAWDAYGALAYLRTLPFVDPDRIGVVGWSHGGISALEAVEETAGTAALPQRFAAAIAFYPYCFEGYQFALPVLILIGEADDWTPLRLCRELKARDPEGTASVELVVYPGAHHGFDIVELGQGFAVDGIGGKPHWLEYDKAAHEDAVGRVDSFLAKQLSPQ